MKPCPSGQVINRNNDMDKENISTIARYYEMIFSLGVFTARECSSSNSDNWVFEIKRGESIIKHHDKGWYYEDIAQDYSVTPIALSVYKKGRQVDIEFNDWTFPCSINGTHEFYMTSKGCSHEVKFLAVSAEGENYEFVFNEVGLTDQEFLVLIFNEMFRRAFCGTRYDELKDIENNGWVDSNKAVQMLGDLETIQKWLESLSSSENEVVSGIAKYYLRVVNKRKKTIKEKVASN